MISRIGMKDGKILFCKLRETFVPTRYMYGVLLSKNVRPKSLDRRCSTHTIRNHNISTTNYNLKHILTSILKHTLQSIAKVR